MTNHYVNAYSAAIVFTLGNQLTKLYFAYLYVKLVLHSSLAGSAQPALLPSHSWKPAKETAYANYCIFAEFTLG